MFLKIKLLLGLLFAVAILAEDDLVDDRIVGGVAINISDRIFQVSVRPFDSICGGSLINENWVLTAAHCTNKFQAGDFTIRGGSNYYFIGGFRRFVKTIYQHPGFNSSTLANDISVLELSEPFQKLPGKIGIIQLATELPPVGTNVTVSGYGTIGSGKEVSQSLMVADVQVKDWQTCNDNYRNILTPKSFCAAADGKDSCQGDSGGPLTYNGQLVGVVSFGYGCADSKYPGVYTSVPAYMDWIQQVTGLDFSSQTKSQLNPKKPKSSAH